MKELIQSICINKIILVVSLIFSKRISHKVRVSRSIIFWLWIFLLFFIGFSSKLPSTFRLIFYLDIIGTIFLLYWSRDLNIIGITGTIGSGKTTLIKQISYHYPQIPILEIDWITRSLFRQPFFIQKVKQIFKNQNVTKENQSKERLHKKRISEIIFGRRNFS